MDPITLEAQRFRRMWRCFWESPPGHEARMPKALRVVVGERDRERCLQALRWIEWQPENRHAFVMLEMPFDSEEGFVSASAVRLDENLAALRAALAEDGPGVPALPPVPAPRTTAALRERLASAVKAVCRALGGLVLVIAPRPVADVRGFERFTAALVEASDGAALRVVALDEGVANLSGIPAREARFEVQEVVLLNYLRQMGTARAPVHPQGEGMDVGAGLRVHLLDAGQAMKEGAPSRAARKLRAASRLCRARGLSAEVAAIGVALGNAEHAAGDMQAALAAFREAKSVALAAGQRGLASQAALGAAGVLFGARRYEDALAAYAEVATATEEAPMLRAEARRMIGLCERLCERAARADAAGRNAG